MRGELFGRLSLSQRSQDCVEAILREIAQVRNLSPHACKLRLDEPEMSVNWPRHRLNVRVYGFGLNFQRRNLALQA